MYYFFNQNQSIKQTINLKFNQNLLLTNISSLRGH